MRYEGTAASSSSTSLPAEAWRDASGTLTATDAASAAGEAGWMGIAGGEVDSYPVSAA